MANLAGSARDYLNSPRRQRQLFWISGAVLVAGVVVFVSLVFFRGTGNAFTSTISTVPAQLYHPDPKAKITKQEISLARRFIETAVERKDLDAAYDIVHADLKGTMSRRTWDKGNIPVIYYEAENAKTAAFVVDYSYRTQALLEVDLVARPNTEERPHLLFYLGLRRAGGKPNGRWLVNYWQPNWRPPIPAALN